MALCKTLTCNNEQLWKTRAKLISLWTSCGYLKTFKQIFIYSRSKPTPFFTAHRVKDFRSV